MPKLKHLQRSTLAEVDFKEHTEFEELWNLENQQKCLQRKISVWAVWFSIMIKKKRDIYILHPILEKKNISQS